MPRSRWELGANFLSLWLAEPCRWKGDHTSFMLYMLLIPSDAAAALGIILVVVISVSATSLTTGNDGLVLITA